MLQHLMLSAIVVSSPATAGRRGVSAPLMRTLAALVPAAIEGVVREVALVDFRDDGEIAALADEAGCTLVDGPNFAESLTRAVAASRSSMLLVLKAGTVPSRLFGEEVAQVLGQEGDAPGSLVLRGEPSGPFARMTPGRWAPIAGVILPRTSLAAARCQDFADVVRRGRPARPLPSFAAIRN